MEQMRIAESLGTVHTHTHTHTHTLLIENKLNTRERSYIRRMYNRHY